MFLCHVTPFCSLYRSEVKLIGDFRAAAEGVPTAWLTNFMLQPASLVEAHTLKWKWPSLALCVSAFLVQDSG